MTPPHNEKPLMSRGASWILFFTAALPAISLLILIGAILLLEDGATSKAFGGLCIVAGVAALVGSTVMFLRKRPSA